jgi:hypothetical protein
MTTLGKIWKARKQILEGAFNLVVKDEFVENVAEFRMNICKGCKYYDGNCAVPGTGPCCGACGCSLKVKVRSLSTVCGKLEKNENPLWLPVISSKEEQELEAKEYEYLNAQNDEQNNLSNKN